MLNNAAWILVALTLRSVPPPAAPAPQHGHEPLSHLVQNLGHDLEALPRLETAATMAVGLVGAAGARTTDTQIADWVARSGPTSYTRIGGTIGNGWFQGGGAVATYAAGRLARAPTVTALGSDLIRAQALNGVLTTALKFTWARTRPNGGPRSFPSGHSSASFASATVIESHLGWKAGVAAYAAAGFIGWTRVRGNHHWLSDVVFGSMVGVISGRTVVAGHGRGHGWRVVPVSTPESAAVYVVRGK